ncbi:heavy metal translocating P-type ATPase [Thermosipho atlanticus]|uniref:Cu2+-exporting ATPase n=1 Tax=Thermosipho atlanticus DSM 15807 TaxID=1123380 RepID=A0A1M5RB30_9BACT|nr:copper-translocating P-type ATPase [Thermosipho atlanticus]SHH23471.1 Cu2+-exporting ATPase [Thermosipho atlanticus DSM 15807]
MEDKKKNLHHEEHQHTKEHEGHGHSMKHEHSEHENQHESHKSHEHMEHAEHAKHTEHTEHTGHAEDGHHNHHSHHAHMVADFRKRFWVSLILTVPVLILSPLIQKLFGLEKVLTFPGDLYVLFGISTLIFFYGGYPFLKGFYEELKNKKPGMMTLIAVAISTAYVYSSVVVFGLEGEMFFWELATLIDIMLFGHWIEMKSVMGASRALEELAKLMPSDAHKLMPDGSLVDVPLEELKPGDIVLVKPGEKVPADGIIIDGESSLNESMLTGESKPVHKKKNDIVIGGSINGEGSLKIEVKKTGKDSYLSQVIELVKEAQESKSKTQDLANRAAVWLTGIALSTGALTFFVWTLVMGKSFVFALERTVTVMVIACPHALGLAVPLVVAVSTAISAKNGLLIRDRVAFEKARNIQAIVFDKTGTLTMGKFGVTDVVKLSDDITEDEILSYAASVELHSEHPIAKAIAQAGKNRMNVDDFKAIPGKGAEGIVDGKHVMVVSPGYLREKGIKIENEKINEMLSAGKTVVYLLIDDELKGAIGLADIIRPESKEAIARLKKMGIKCMMLTGDNEQVAKWVAKELNLDEYFAEVLPHEKSQKIKEIQSRNLVVAMTGDGVNDAPALVQADVGIAIGAGTDVAVESADIILVRSDPRDVVAIIELAKKTYKKMVQNLLWATGYNAIAIPLAAGVLYKFGILLSPAIGAVFMSLSTVIVAINAKLLKLER